MSTHNICFLRRNKKNISTVRLTKKGPYLELMNSSAVGIKMNIKHSDNIFLSPK